MTRRYRQVAKFSVMSHVCWSRKYGGARIEIRRRAWTTEDRTRSPLLAGNNVVERTDTYWHSILIAPQEVRERFDALTRRVKMLVVWPSLRRSKGAGVGSMSRAWLREHEAEAKKHLG